VSGPPRRDKGEAGGQAPGGAGGPAADSSGSLSAHGSGARRKVSSSQSLPAAASGELSLDQVLGDEPILVVDELPHGRLFGDQSGWARPIRLRLDTLAVAGAAFAVLITIAFVVGRGTSQAPGDGGHVAQADTRRGDIALALGAGGRGEPAHVPQATAAPSAPGSGGSAAPTPNPGHPSTAASGASSSGSAPGGQPAAAGPRIQIRALTAERPRAEAVKAFLEGKGFRVYLDPVNAHTTIVRVGGYASMTAPDAVADLKAIRALSFDRRALDDAYFVPWKAGS
jgi:hypothetical protein